MGSPCGSLRFCGSVRFVVVRFALVCFVSARLASLSPRFVSPWSGSVRCCGSLRFGSGAVLVSVRFGGGVVLGFAWGLAVVLSGSLGVCCRVAVAVLFRLGVFAGRCVLSVVSLLSPALPFPPAPGFVFNGAVRHTLQQVCRRLSSSVVAQFLRFCIKNALLFV